MIDYLINIIEFISPYLNLAVTLTILWSFIVNFLMYVTKIKYKLTIESEDINNIATSIVLLLMCIFVFYVI